MQHERGSQPQKRATSNGHDVRPQLTGTDRTQQIKPGDNAAHLTQTQKLLVVHATGFRTQRPPGTPQKAPPVYYISPQKVETASQPPSARRQPYDGFGDRQAQHLPSHGSSQGTLTALDSTLVAGVNGAFDKSRYVYGSVQRVPALVLSTIDHMVVVDDEPALCSFLSWMASSLMSHACYGLR